MSGYQKSARYYDLIYSDKDYVKECNFLEKIFTKFSKKPDSILDLGCGTGGHAIQLAKRGYRVSGIDISRKMINVARSKIEQAGGDIEFFVSPMQQLRVNKKFDVCISMFSSINYLLTYGDIKKTFTTVWSHLRKKGLFVFDCWNGVAVAKFFSPVGVKKYESKKDMIIRISQTRLNKTKKSCKVKWIYIIMENNRVINSFSELLKLRISFLKDLRYLLKLSGFRVLHTCPFMKLNGQIHNDSWNITVIAEKVKG